MVKLDLKGNEKKKLLRPMVASTLTFIFFSFYERQLPFMTLLYFHTITITITIRNSLKLKRFIQNERYKTVSLGLGNIKM